VETDEGAREVTAVLEKVAVGLLMQGVGAAPFRQGLLQPWV